MSIDRCDNCYEAIENCNCEQCAKCKEFHPLWFLYERNGLVLCETCTIEFDKSSRNDKGV